MCELVVSSAFKLRGYYHSLWALYVSGNGCDLAVVNILRLSYFGILQRVRYCILELFVSLHQKKLSVFSSHDFYVFASEGVKTLTLHPSRMASKILYTAVLGQCTFKRWWMHPCFHCTNMSWISSTGFCVPEHILWYPQFL